MKFSPEEEFDLDCNDYDIIIVGGGLTGLSAAHSILKKRANLSLLIIEAEDLLGGRLSSAQALEFSSHSFQSNLLNLIEEMEIDIEFHDKNDKKKRIFVDQGSTDEPSSIVALQVYYFYKLLDEWSLDPHLDVSKFYGKCTELAEMSVDDLIKQMVLSSRAKTICRTFISLICGMINLKNVSALWLLLMLHGAGGLFNRFELILHNNSRYFIKGGVSILLDKLRDEIVKDGVIKYSEKVIKINFNEYRNFVETSRKIYKCSYVIIAVPPPKNAEIIIEGLPKNYVKFQNLFTSVPIIYFEIEFNRNFWYPWYSGIVVAYSGGDNGLMITRDVTCTSDNRVKRMSGFLNASNDLSREERLWNFLGVMIKAFGANAANAYVDYHEERFNDGVMSVLRPCLIGDHLNLMENPYDRIFFAASEYANEWPGTADGAVEAGEHVACLILYHTRPQSLNRFQISKYMSSKIQIPESRFEYFVAGTALLVANTMIFYSFFRDAYKF